LTISIDRELEFMIKYQLNAEEFYVVKLIFMAQNNKGNYLINYYSQISQKNKLRDIVSTLQEKGIINKSYKIPKEGSNFIPSDVDFNKNFLKGHLQHSNELGMELFMSYPSFVNINGRNCSLKNITKQFSSLDDFCFAYGKSIKFDPVIHKEVLESLEHAKEHNMIHYGICEFILSMKWLEIEEAKNLGIQNMNSDNITSL